MKIKRSAYEQIKDTVGRKHPEEGGILFTNDGGQTISLFVYDPSGRRSATTYTPNTNFINQKIKELNKDGYYFIGFVHSHPRGFTGLSMGKGGNANYTASDEEAVYKLLSGMKGTKRLYFPIVQSSDTGKFSMKAFLGEKRYDGTIQICEDNMEIVEDCMEEKERQIICENIAMKRFENNTVIIIGNTDKEMVARLARNGIHKFVLISDSKYLSSDIRNNANYNEVGGYRADSLARHIQQINPLAEVKIIRKYVERDTEYNEFARWIGKVNKSQSIIVVCDSSCETISSTKKLASKIGIPLVRYTFHSDSIVKFEYYDFYIMVKPEAQILYKNIPYGFNRMEAVPLLLNQVVMDFFDHPIANKRREANACKEEQKSVWKFSTLYSQDEIEKKTVVVVGCGGSRSYIENLARSGIRRFVLWDGDVYGDSNLQTQTSFVDELGESKVEVISNRIRLINPEADVIAIPRMMDSSVTDEEFANFIGRTIYENPFDVLIAGCTDNFEAQARCSRLALKYGCPYIQAGIYPGGRVMEIIFFHPAVSHVCPRCMLKNRYKANLNSTKKPAPAVSDGTSVFFTEELNAKKGYISLGLLLYNTASDRRYSKFLDDNMWSTPNRKKKVDRNFLFYTMDPCFEKSTGKKAFDDWGKKLGSKYQVGVSYWRKQTPREKCPDCGGTGNLLKLKGNIDDTRKGIYFDIGGEE